jgi:hypothetical protein
MNRANMSAGLSAAVACLAITVASCGGGGTASAPPNVVNSTALVAGAATLTIPNASSSTSASARRAQWVSPSTVSAGLRVNGGSAIYVDVSKTSSLCTVGATSRTCTIPTTAPVGNDAVTVSLYDQPNGGGNLMGTGSASQTVVLGTPFTINLTINPQVGTATNPVVTYPSGTSFVTGTAGTATVSFTLADPDGNTIPAGTTILPSLSASSSDANVTATVTAVGTVQLAYNGSSSVASSLTIKLAQQAGGSTTTGVLATAPVTVSSGSNAAFNGCTPGNAADPFSAIPGTYTFLSEGGSYSTSFSPTGGAWSAVTVNAGTAPSPSPSVTSAPTASPSQGPTSPPTLYWAGTYTVNGFTTLGIGSSPAPVNVSPTAGCVVITATVGSTGGVVAFPSFISGTNLVDTTVAGGSIISFAFVPPLSTTGGPFNATFTLSSGASGTATVTYAGQIGSTGLIMPAPSPSPTATSSIATITLTPNPGTLSASNPLLTETASSPVTNSPFVLQSITCKVSTVTGPLPYTFPGGSIQNGMLVNTQTLPFGGTPVPGDVCTGVVTQGSPIVAQGTVTVNVTP